MSNIKLFEDTNIRGKWNEDEDCWYLVVTDVISFLTDSPDPADYWYRMKKRAAEYEGVELSTICRELKLKASNGKTYKYECANNEGIFRIIQSVPSPKAEPFKKWLAKLGSERIEEIEQPGKAIERGKLYYQYKGRSEDWVNDRLSAIQSRNELTDHWKSTGIKGKEYAILTNEIYVSTFGLDAIEYKEHKGIGRNDSLRDNMNNIELVVSEVRRTSPPASKFNVVFENSDIKEGSCLVTYAGFGNTIDAAIKDYCEKISGGLLIVNAFPPSEKRREILLPKLQHTKLLHR